MNNKMKNIKQKQPLKGALKNKCSWNSNKTIKKKTNFMAPFLKSPLMFSIPVEKPVKQIKAHSIDSNIHITPSRRSWCIVGKV